MFDHFIDFELSYTKYKVKTWKGCVLLATDLPCSINNRELFGQHGYETMYYFLFLLILRRREYISVPAPAMKDPR